MNITDKTLAELRRKRAAREAKEEAEKKPLRELRKQLAIASLTKEQHEQIMVPTNTLLPGYEVSCINLRYCPRCGAEVYGYDQCLHGSSERINAEIKNCPVCGSSFAFDHGYRDYEYHPKEPVKLHELFARMENLRIPSEVMDFEAKLSKKVADYVPAAEEVSSIRIAEIKENPEKLKEYIANLIALESNIYSIKRRISILYFQQRQADRAILFASKISDYENEKQRTIVNELQNQQQLLVNRTDMLHKAKAQQLTSPDNIVYPQKPKRPELLPVGFFDFAGNKAKNQSMMLEYEKMMENYKQKVAECDREKTRLENAAKEQHLKIAQIGSQINEIKSNISKYQALLKSVNSNPKVGTTPAHGIKAFIDKEIVQAEAILKDLLDTRSKLYGFNIVFGKYRDLAILSTFYEYLLTGRCNSLEGASGAYNLYESELRSNIIIGKLSDVLTSLEELKSQLSQTQYTIISLLQDVNSNLKELDQKMSSACSAIYDIRSNTADANKFLGQIAENSQVIAYNTAATAYYSKVNAELTNSMGYLMAYKL